MPLTPLRVFKEKEKKSPRASTSSPGYLHGDQGEPAGRALYHLHMEVMQPASAFEICPFRRIHGDMFYDKKTSPRRVPCLSLKALKRFLLHRAVAQQKYLGFNEKLR